VLALLMSKPWDTAFRPTRKATAGLLLWVLLGLYVRPYAPFLPAHRFVAGPITRTEEYFRGQVPR
jgi:hypothetical protein